jgi:hypothetical protein
MNNAAARNKTQITIGLDLGDRQDLIGKQRMKYNAGSLPGMRDDHKVGTILPKKSHRIRMEA